MLLILAGAIWGSLTGFFAQEMIPGGQTFQIRNIFDAGPWAAAQIPKDWAVKVNRFWIDFGKPVWVCLSLHRAVPQPGRLLQQAYIASVACPEIEDHMNC